MSIPARFAKAPKRGRYASYEVTTRGTSNSNERGSSYGRRRRRDWVMENFASDVPKHVRCYRCGDLLNDDTLTIDRIKPGCRGGRYTRDNIRPCCGTCNSSTGATTRSTG